MKISTPFATFLATPIAGEKVALFAHSPQHLTRLFQSVGLEAHQHCLYSDRFKSHIAVAPLENDDFTLLLWAIEERHTEGSHIGNFQKRSAVAAKPVANSYEWYELLPAPEIRASLSDMQWFMDTLNIARIESEETERYYRPCSNVDLGYGRDEQTLAIRCFVSQSGLLLPLTSSEQEKV